MKKMKKKDEEAKLAQTPASSIEEKEPEKNLSSPLPQEAEQQPPPQSQTDEKEEPVTKTVELRRRPPEEVKISSLVLKKNKLLNETESRELYNQAVAIIRDIFAKVKNNIDIGDEDKNIITCVGQLVDQQMQGNDYILHMINTPAEKDFIYGHVVNTGIVSVDIGIGIGYDKVQLNELGTAAMVHDIGMVKYYDLYTKSGPLTPREFNILKNHPAVSVEILEKFRHIYKRSLAAVYHEHERIDGTGYPRGVKGESIDEYAKIIMLADEYDAMTHERPHRRKYDAQESLKQLLEAKDSFERKITRVMIERIACPFPLGSFVKLSSGERGRVVKRNLTCTLRPTVEVSYDTSGEHLVHTKIVDLSKQQMVFIERQYLEEEQK
ncbi:MAG: HD domain-containing phosphohydrolase [Candidatus Omnitrophota bacterium]